jgi:S1-C subfamily serine protease
MLGALLGAAAMKELGGLAQLPLAEPDSQEETGDGQIPGVLPDSEEHVPIVGGTSDEQQAVQVISATVPNVVQVQVFREVANSGSGGTSEVMIGSGSGFVYDSTGHIITNNHVVEEGDSLRVEFPDNQQLAATVVGTDRLTDLAVIRVAELPSNVKPLPLANTDKLQVGQTAIAIGNPMTSGADQFGLGRTPTVTRGIVSAVDRTMPVMSDNAPNVVEFRIENLIQTDAAINQGNSGGPLIDSQGRVIGVNTAIIPTVQGIGFAVPANTVREVAPQLIEEGKVQRPLMGIQFRGLSDIIASTPETVQFPVQKGAVIMEVTEGGPADRAGLRGTRFDPRGRVQAWGDIIVAINEVEVTGNSLAQEILRYDPGDRVSVTYYRGDEKQETVVELGAR